MQFLRFFRASNFQPFYIIFFYNKLGELFYHEISDIKYQQKQNYEKLMMEKVILIHDLLTRVQKKIYNVV